MNVRPLVVVSGPRYVTCRLHKDLWTTLIGQLVVVDGQGLVLRGECLDVGCKGGGKCLDKWRNCLVVGVQGWCSTPGRLTRRCGCPGAGILRGECLDVGGGKCLDVSQRRGG